MKIVTVKQMQTIEQRADAAGLSYDTMMQHAGRGIANWVYQHLPVNAGVIGLIGSGNNGGDTIIALTCLAKWGVRTAAFLVKRRSDELLLSDYKQHGGIVIDVSENVNLDILEAMLIPGTVVLDGVLGTGLKLPLRGALSEVMANIHKLLVNRLEVLKIAVDCPSGVDCDTGETSEVTIQADHTLTMAAMKQGLLRHPARAFSGDFHFISIGIDDLSGYISEDLPEMIDQAFIHDMLPKRPDDGHKGTFGTCLIVAGSTPFTGAAYLTGKSAYRAGCGLVQMGALRSVQRSLSGRLIEAVWTVLPDDDGAYDPKGVVVLEDGLKAADSIVLGPGWGLGEQNVNFLEGLLRSIPKKTPTLIDADGLKLLSQLERWWTMLPEHCVLTPHPGEMSILTGLGIQEVQANRWSLALESGQRWNVTVLLKGAMTVIANPGKGIFVSPISSSALATAGSGDVLAGVMGGLLAQGLSVQTASVLGVWVHGIAGQVAHHRLGTDFSVTAMDILDTLPDGFLKAKEAGI